jgi:hypothetical protein
MAGIGEPATNVVSHDLADTRGTRLTRGGRGHGLDDHRTYRAGEKFEMGAPALATEHLGDGLVVATADGNTRERSHRWLNGGTFAVREATHIRGGTIDNTSSAINHHRESHVVHRLRENIPIGPGAFIGQRGGDGDLTLAVK